MKEKLTQLLQEGKDRIAAVRSEAELQEVKALLLGKQGSLTGLLKELPKLDAALRPEMGKAVNQAKAQLTALLDQRREELKLKASEVSPDFDISVPGILPPSGGLHPITQMCYDLNDAFRSMGFEIFEESDITSELYGFDNLNFPPNHPARESMDTYWLEGHDKGECWDKLCLRPHLTGGSVRYMQTHKPPYRFVYPGRVYRNETTDARHERAFFQYEALIVDKDFTFASGKVMIKSILSKVFGRDVPVRMRAGFFPFVEPGFEIDMGCLVCGGKGCSVCKHVGWIEIMPGGTPHPNVLRAAGLDPDEYTGFYVNIGLDRLVMMRYGVDDVRLFHSADLRFLQVSSIKRRVRHAMKVSLNWIKDYVKLPEDMDLTRLAYDLTMSTVEVEGAEDLAKPLRAYAGGRGDGGLPASRTPTSCGSAERTSAAATSGRSSAAAPTCTAGMRVAVACPGALCRWHGEGEPVEIKESKLRGVKSYGMICAASEIGLGDLFPTDEEAHILDLSAFDVPAGTPIADGAGSPRHHSGDRQQVHDQPPRPVGPLRSWPVRSPPCTGCPSSRFTPLPAVICPPAD